MEFLQSTRFTPLLLLKIQRYMWQPEPYQPHSIPPIGKWGTLSQGAQNSVPLPHSAPEKASIPKLKYETLEISEVRGLFERKVLMHYSYFGPH